MELFWNRDSSVSSVRLRAVQPSWFTSWHRYYTHHSKASRPSLVPTKHLIQWVMAALYQWVKRPGREAEHWNLILCRIIPKISFSAHGKLDAHWAEYFARKAWFSYIFWVSMLLKITTLNTRLRSSSKGLEASVDNFMCNTFIKSLRARLALTLLSCS
jgi:hypothetical protein